MSQGKRRAQSLENKRLGSQLLSLGLAKIVSNLWFLAWPLKAHRKVCHHQKPEVCRYAVGYVLEWIWTMGNPTKIDSVIHSHIIPSLSLQWFNLCLTALQSHCSRGFHFTGCSCLEYLDSTLKLKICCFIGYSIHRSNEASSQSLSTATAKSRNWNGTYKISIPRCACERDATRSRYTKFKWDMVVTQCIGTADQ